MALEDLAMARGVPNATILYPCDGVSTHRLLAVAAATHGPVYIRLSRPKTPVIYGPQEAFPPGGSKTLRQSGKDVATVVAAGVTVFQALTAHDALAKEGIAIRVIDAYSVQPIDREGLIAAGRATNGQLITVEDHYAHGGLGDAVSEAVGAEGYRVRRLAVREIPRSGQPDELLERFGISSDAIIAAVKAITREFAARS
jgi:transketolase